MGSIRQEAENYEPPQTMNVADLSHIPIDELELLEEEKTNQDGENFRYKYFEIEGKKYRVPNMVLEEIQKILKLKPDVKNVKVTKTGSGLATRYKVGVVEIPTSQ